MGSGAFSQVYRGTWNYTNVVIKRYDKLEPDSQKIFLNEIEILSKLRHPNIILYLGHFIEDNYYTIVTEEMSDNIQSYLLENFSIHLNSKKMIDICIDIAKAFVYLHSQEIPILH